MILPTQDDDIWSQLIHGIRYFDIRLHYKHSNNPSHANVFISQGTSISNQISSLIDDVKRFIADTHEIIVLDFKNFTSSFKEHPEAHDIVAKYINDSLAPMLSKESWYSSLNDAWNDNNRTIFIGYGRWKVVAKYDFMRKSFAHLWNNITEPRPFIARIKDHYKNEIQKR